MALEKEDIMALIAILQKGLTDDEPELLYQEESPPKTETKKKRSAPESKLNKFDSMSEKNMHKQDTEIDKKLWGNNLPSDRGRPPSLINVKCRMCGKNENVSSSLVDSVERYKCNKCSSSSG